MAGPAAGLRPVESVSKVSPARPQAERAERSEAAPRREASENRRSDVRNQIASLLKDNVQSGKLTREQALQALDFLQNRPEPPKPRPAPTVETEPNPASAPPEAAEPVQPQPREKPEAVRILQDLRKQMSFTPYSPPDEPKREEKGPGTIGLVDKVA